MIPGIVAGQMRPAGGGGGGTDPHWANVVSLARFDSDFVDAKDAVTWTKIGSVVIQSDAGALGGAGAYNPGNNNWLERTIPAIGTQDFTLEFRLKRSAVTKVDIVFDLRAAGVTGTGLVMYKSTDITTTLYVGGSALIAANLGAMTEWTALCIERAAGVMRLYKDGVEMGSAASGYNVTTTKLRMLNSIVNSAQWTTQGTQGLLDELRLTIGVARHQGNYTPATVAFPAG